MEGLDPERRAVSQPIDAPSDDGAKTHRVGSLKGKRGTKKPWTIAWCHAGDSGGSKRAAFEMVRELAKRGHVIDEYIIRLGEPNLQHFPLQPYIRESFQVTFKQMGRRLRPYLLDVWIALLRNTLQMHKIRRQLEQLAGKINHREYDVVHIDQCAPCLAVSLLPYLLVPTVVYTHEASNRRDQAFERPDSAKRESRRRRMYTRLCEVAERMWNGMRNQQDMEDMRRAAVILTNSHYSREAIFQRNFCSATVCRYGVDADIFRPLPMKREHMILSAGRIVTAKQHHTVIEAAGMIPEVRRPRVLIATPEDVTRQQDVQYCESLRRLATTKKVELTIHFNPTQHELVTLYNRAISMVFVPIMEPFGLVALEAMACGTAVIGVREAGIRESIIDGVTGVLVERDTEEIAHAIDHVAQNEDIRAKLGQGAMECVRAEWTWGRMIDRYESHVSKLMA